MWFKFIFLSFFAIFWRLEPTSAARIDLVAIGNLVEEVNEKFGNIYRNIRKYDNSFQAFPSEEERKLRKYALESFYKYPWIRYLNIKDERKIRYYQIYVVAGSYLLSDSDYIRLTEILNIAPKYSQEAFNSFKEYLDSELLSKIAANGDQMRSDEVDKIDEKIQKHWSQCSTQLAEKVKPLIKELGAIIEDTFNPSEFGMSIFGMLGYGFYMESYRYQNACESMKRTTNMVLSYFKTEVVKKLKLRKSYLDHPMPAYIYSILRNRDLYRKVFTEPDLTDLLQRAITSDNEWTIKRITEQAENFFVSMNFSSLGTEFWEKSQLLTINNQESSRPISSVFANKDNYQLNVESTVSLEAYESIHRHMFRLYRNIIMDENNVEWSYRVSDFHAFDDAIEDALILSTKSITYALKTGILNNDDYTEKHVFDALLAEASSVFTMFSSVMALNEWSAAQVREDFNHSQWTDRLKHENVLAVPKLCTKPEDSDSFIDCSSPEHAFPYRLYMLNATATMLKYQIFGALCKMAGQYSPDHPLEKPLHKCDLSGSTQVGNFLKDKILPIASGKLWKDMLTEISGTERLDPTYLIDYFKPCLQALALVELLI